MLTKKEMKLAAEMIGLHLKDLEGDDIDYSHNLESWTKREIADLFDYAYQKKDSDGELYYDNDSLDVLEELDYGVIANAIKWKLEDESV